MQGTDLAQSVRSRLDRDIAEAERKLVDLTERSAHALSDYDAARSKLRKAVTGAAQRMAGDACRKAMNEVTALIEQRARAQKVLAALRRPETYEARLDEARDRGGVVA